MTSYRRPQMSEEALKLFFQQLHAKQDRRWFGLGRYVRLWRQRQTEKRIIKLVQQQAKKFGIDLDSE